MTASPSRTLDAGVRTLDAGVRTLDAGVRTLVAGVGNMFLGDDGFGPEVARQLSSCELPPGVRVEDYGIRGTHLAFDLLSGWDALVLVDTVASRDAPGAIHILEVGPDDVDGAAFDPHGMDPNSMLAGVRSLGGMLPPTVVVGCEPAVLDDGIGLSAEVADAVPRAVRAVLRLLASTTTGAPETTGAAPCVSASPAG